MTDSAYRINNFYFPQKKETSRVDIKTNSRLETFDYYLSPYSILQDRGHTPTSIVLQGFIDTFTTGSSGAWGLEKLKAEGIISTEPIPASTPGICVHCNTPTGDESSVCKDCEFPF